MNAAIEFIAGHTEKIFQVHRKDWNKILYLSLLNFLLFTAAIIGISAATTLFLKRFGVENLPYMYILFAVMTVITTVVYIPIGTKVAKRNIIAYTALVSCFAVFFIRLGLGYKITYAVLYLVSQYVWWMFYSQFWAYALEICSVREGKRIFSLIVCAGLVGGILGGVITTYSVKFIHTESLLLVWISSMLLIFYFLKKIRPPSNQKLIHEDIDEGIVFDKQAIKSDLLKAVNFLYNSKLIRILTLSFLLYGIGVYLLDFVFNEIVDKTFPEADKLVSFYGTYAIYFYAVTLGTELFLSNRILKIIGVGSVMMLLPATLVSGFAFLSFYYMYLAAIITKFVRDVIGNSLTESTYPLLFTPIDRQYRSIAVAFIEGLVIPCGIALSGILLINIMGHFNHKYICVFAAIVSLIWLCLTVFLRKEYISTFIANITTRSFRDKNFLADHLVSLDEVNISSNLRNALYDPNEKVQEIGIEMLGRSKDARAAKLITDFLVNTNPPDHIKAKIIKTLGEMELESSITVLQQYLNYPDPRVRANCVEALGEMDIPDIKLQIENLLNDPSPPVRINTAIVLWKHGNSEDSIQPLIDSFYNTDEITRVRTVYALGKLGSEKARELLLIALKDESNRVKLHAIRGLGLLNDPSVVAPLINLLGTKKRNLRRQLRNILSKMDNITPELVKGLSHPNRVIREQVALILAEQKEEGVSEHIINYCKKEVESVYRDVMRINFMETQNKDAFKLLIESLKQRNDRTVMRVLRIISIIENSEFLSLAIRRLRDEDEKMRDSVLEVMDTLSYGQLLKEIIPLLDEKSEIERNGVIQRQYKQYVIQSFKNIFQELLNDEEEWIRFCTIYVLGEIKEIDLIPELMGFINNESEYIREISIESLCKIGTIRARVVLRDKINDISSKVRNVLSRYQKFINSTASVS